MNYKLLINSIVNGISSLCMANGINLPNNYFAEN